MNTKKHLKSPIKILAWIALLASPHIPLAAALEIAPAAWQSQQSWWPEDIANTAADVTVSEANCAEFLGKGWLISNRIAGLLSGHYSPTEGRLYPVSLTMVDFGNLVVYLGKLDAATSVETSWLVATRKDIPTPNDIRINYMTGAADFQNLTNLNEQIPLSALNVTPNNQAWQRVRFVSPVTIPADTHLYLRIEATGVDPTQAQTLIQDIQVGPAGESAK